MDRNKREIRAWCLYDWANSAYVLTAATAVLPAYFAGVVAPDGVAILGSTYSPSALWGFSFSISALAIFLTAPLLGAVADYTASKRLFLATFCITGSLLAASISLCGPGDGLILIILFILTHSLFAGGNAFYNAFLPEIAGPKEMDRVSAKGFAWGYAGGGLNFLLCLFLMAFHEQIGLTKDIAARISLASAGLWWLLFSLPTLTVLRDRTPPVPLPGDVRGPRKALFLWRKGFSRTSATFRELRRDRNLLLFLAAFLLYNDGIQTVIAMAAIYGKEELALPQTVLMGTLLAVQAVALFGALVFARLAGHTGTKRAVILSLLIWTGAAIYAAFIETALQFFAMGLVIGLVLGAAQSLSRSIYASLVPEEEPAKYFGFYSVVSKLSAIAGPFVFGLVRQATGSSRPAVPLMALFFLAGISLLAFVKIDRR